MDPRCRSRTIGSMRRLLLCCCFAGSGWAGQAFDGIFQYDPQIEVLNIGSILDVRPLVSADRKYITFGAARASFTALEGSFIENIDVLRRMGATPFRANARNLLAGDWDGVAVPQGASEDEAVDWRIRLSNRLRAAGKAFHPLDSIAVVSFDADERRVRLRLRVREPGPERRSMVERTTTDHVLREVLVQGVFGADWRTFEGEYVGEEGRGTVTLERRVDPLPDELSGVWYADCEQGAPDLVAGEDNWVAMAIHRGRPAVVRLPGGRQLALRPLHLNPDDRHLALVALAEPEEEGGEEICGFLHGRFSRNADKLAVHLRCGDLVSNYLLLRKAERVEEEETRRSPEAAEATEETEARR